MSDIVQSLFFLLNSFRQMFSTCRLLLKKYRLLQNTIYSFLWAHPKHFPKYCATSSRAALQSWVPYDLWITMVSIKLQKGDSVFHPVLRTPFVSVPVSSLHKWMILFHVREKANTQVIPAVEDLSNKAFNNGVIWQFYSASTFEQFEGGRFSIKIKSLSRRNSVPVVLKEPVLAALEYLNLLLKVNLNPFLY